LAVDIYIEGERLDIFDDETISIKSSVQDVKDISKIFGDFSQSFTIDIDTLDFKRGKISLQSVKIEENYPVHYNIVFYGDTVKIKDLLGDEKLEQLVWLNNFDHDYTDANVLTGLTTGLDFTFGGDTYTKAICYPLISYKRQWYYDSGAITNTRTDVLEDIAYNASKTEGLSFTELRPAIRLELMLLAITDLHPELSFTQNFFGTELFKQLYVNIYNDESSELANGVKSYDTSTGTFTVLTYRYKYRATVTPDSGFGSIPYKIVMYNDDAIIYESPFITGNQQREAKISISTSSLFTYNLRAEIVTEVDFEFGVTQRLMEQVLLVGDTTIYNTTYAGLTINLDSVITNQLKDIKIYDFLVGLFKMFNLIVTPEGDDLYVNDLQTWYEEGQIYDVTQYVNTESQTVKKADIYNILSFQFKDSKSILANQFKNNNNISYGNLDKKLEDANGTLIDGTTLKIETPFENPVFERLFDTDDNSETTIQYGLMADENLNSQVGEPFLMYLPSVSVVANPIGWNPLTGYDPINTTVLMPSHSMQIDTESFNINFNAEINEYTYQIFTDTLYQRFYADYIGDIFSIKRRLFDFESILPLELKNKLKLNDRLIIRDRRYIINSITTKIDTSLNEYPETLELINDIYDAPLASDVLNNSSISPTFQVYGSSAQVDDFKYIGLDAITASKVDTGDGVTWVTLVVGTSVGTVSNISFTIDANVSGSTRTMQIQMVDGINDPKYTITQDTNGSTFDNTNITFDSTLVTFDRT
jgi:hypothetical protein